MEFRVRKCRVPVLSKGKVVELGLVLPNGQMMRKNDEREYKYRGIVEIDKIKETDMKEKFTSEYKRSLKCFLKLKLNGRVR